MFLPVWKGSKDEDSYRNAAHVYSIGERYEPGVVANKIELENTMVHNQ